MAADPARAATAAAAARERKGARVMTVLQLGFDMKLSELSFTLQLEMARPIFIHPESA
jgi:hypothetical protein